MIFADWLETLKQRAAWSEFTPDHFCSEFWHKIKELVLFDNSARHPVTVCHRYSEPPRSKCCMASLYHRDRGDTKMHRLQRWHLVRNCRTYYIYTRHCRLLLPMNSKCCDPKTCGCLRLGSSATVNNSKNYISIIINNVKFYSTIIGCVLLTRDCRLYM